MTILGFIFGCIFVIISYNIFYSDYRKDAISQEWVRILYSHSSTKSLEVLDTNNFPYSEYILKNDDFIFLTGFNNQVVVFFYKDDNMEWKCITNTRLKTIGENTCY